MDLRQAKAVADFLHDIGDWTDKMSIHEAHLRECGLGELAVLSQKVRENFMAILYRFAKMAQGDG